MQTKNGIKREFRRIGLNTNLMEDTSGGSKQYKGFAREHAQRSHEHSLARRNLSLDSFLVRLAVFQGKLARRVEEVVLPMG